LETGLAFSVTALSIISVLSCVLGLSPAAMAVNGCGGSGGSGGVSPSGVGSEDRTANAAVDTVLPFCGSGDSGCGN
jgi:hypothetical protein